MFGKMNREQLQALIENAFRPFQQPRRAEDLDSGGIDGEFVIKNYFGLTRMPNQAIHLMLVPLMLHQHR